MQKFLLQVPHVITAFLCLSLLDCHSFSGEEPEELTTIRASYQEKIARATKPIHSSYLKALESLKRKLGAKGDAEGALAIQKEIDRMSVRLIRGGELVGRWLWQGGKGFSVTFTPDHRAITTKQSYTLKTWQHVKENRFMAITKDGKKMPMWISGDGKTLEISKEKWRYLKVLPKDEE